MDSVQTCIFRNREKKSIFKFSYYKNVLNNKLIFLSTVIIIIIIMLTKFHSIEAAAALSNPDLIDNSFKRLESGENSDEEINQCCGRESKFITVGHGLDADEIRVDVGYCRQHCETARTRPLKREEFDKYLKKYPDVDPIQIFLSLQNQQTEGEDQVTLPIQRNHTLRTSTASCLSSICQPLSIRREKHFDLTGQQKNVDVVDSCDCVSIPQSCQKSSFLVRVHVGTPYEKPVDVGQCIGPCGNNVGHGNDPDTNCRPVRNRTVTIEGPNGSECMEVIEECQCVGDCYRSREFYKIYDYSQFYENKINTNESKGINDDEDIREREPLTKIIDIGRCEGSCRNAQVMSKCLAWSDKNETCLSSLYGGQSQCSANKFMYHSYVDKTGHKHTLISVTSCGCR